MSMAALSFSSSGIVSITKPASPEAREAFTFFAAGYVAQIVSLICASHIPQAIPSIFKTA